MTEQNRRQSVRVNDRILFGCTRVAPEKYQKVADDFAQGISPYKHESMAEIRTFIGAQHALFRIREKDEYLAEFLQCLDAKVNLLLKRSSDEKSVVDALVQKDVNLSGGGLAFQSHHAFKPGEILAFHLVLLPDHIYVFCFGKVIRSERLKQVGEHVELFRVSVRFTLLAEEDQEKLIKHTFKQQTLALRSRRQRPARGAATKE